MKIQSPDFKEGDFIPSDFTCDGSGINPTLKISEVSDKAKELILIVSDPDAPSGTFWHWILAGIGPNVSKIESGVLPEGTRELTNSSGKASYTPACPPSGTHHYVFKIIALSENLDNKLDIKAYELEKIISPYIIESSQLVGLYQRNN